MFVNDVKVVEMSKGKSFGELPLGEEAECYGNHKIR